MSTHPLVTFIVTTFNLPVELLRECLGSVLSVDLLPEEREVLLIDDGSASSPWEELPDFHAHVRYIRKENGGLSSARNMGIEAARGEYIQFVDGDDRLITPAYNLVIGQMRRRQYDVVLFRYSTVIPARRTVGERLDLFLVSFGDAYLRRHNLRSAACAYSFRRKALGDLRFTPGIVHEDAEFTPLLFLRAAYIARTTARAYYYRQREGSIMNSPSPEALERRFRDMLGVILRLDRRSRQGRDGHSLTRRVDQLLMDHLYNIARLTRSAERIEQETALLRGGGLFPLPLHRHTAKYLAFALLTRLRFVRRLLAK